jgi:hypothetical protein
MSYEPSEHAPSIRQVVGAWLVCGGLLGILALGAVIGGAHATPRHETQAAGIVCGVDAVGPETRSGCVVPHRVRQRV